jgi:uncharacterized membrane protein
VVCSAFVILWSAVRNLYGVVWQGDIGFLLTCLGKALTLGSGILLMLLVDPASSDTTTFKRWSHYISLFSFQCTGLFLFVSGIQHFLFVDFVKMLIPSWIPWPVFWSYFSGVALSLLGLALLMGIKRNVVSLMASLMIFSWVMIVHIPRAFVTLKDQNEWTALFEAIAFASILFILARTSTAFVSTRSVQYTVFNFRKS